MKCQQNLVIVLNSDFTDVEWGAADRSALGRQRPLSSKGRRTISKQSPNGCLGLIEPASCKEGPSLEERVNMKREEIYVGIDVAKDRVDVAIRPGGDTWSGVDPTVRTTKEPS